MDNGFEYYTQTKYFHCKYAKGAPSAKGTEFHNYNEFVFFIKGSSFLVSENIQLELNQGSVVLIPKEHFHRFCISQPENYVRCILGFCPTEEIDEITDEIFNTIKVITLPDKKIISAFLNLTDIMKGDISSRERNLFVQSSLIQLLIYLKQNNLKTIIKNTEVSPEVKGALKIIDEKYAEKLTVDSIAKMLYISPSTLAHKFSKELKISVYLYITKKRLSMAHELIMQGKPTTKAALYSGFNDYSCFYRLYKKYYN